MVRSFDWFLGAFGGGGCGTSASRPFGVTGTMTMKMISRTRSTSISGVTLISDTAPPEDPPLIPIANLLDSSAVPLRVAAAGRENLRPLLLVIGQQVELADAGGA